MKNKIQDVRDHLIAQMEAIREADVNNPEALKAELDKGRVLSEITKAITETARVEVEAIRTLTDANSKGTGFIPLAAPDKPALPPVRN